MLVIEIKEKINCMTVYYTLYKHRNTCTTQQQRKLLQQD